MPRKERRKTRGTRSPWRILDRGKRVVTQQKRRNGCKTSISSFLRIRDHGCGQLPLLFRSIRRPRTSRTVSFWCFPTLLMHAPSFCECCASFSSQGALTCSLHKEAANRTIDSLVVCRQESSGRLVCSTVSLCSRK